jgi:hypothetical protein
VMCSCSCLLLNLASHLAQKQQSRSAFAQAQARMLLRPDKAIITEPHHVWPTLTDEQWIKVRAHGVPCPAARPCA